MAATIAIAAIVIVIKISDAIENSRPCAHGVRGAGHTRAKCAECAKEDHEANAAKVREEIIARNKREERRRKDAERARELEIERLKHLRTRQALQSLDPRKFELLICDAYRRQGYVVTSTPYTGDAGIDGFLKKDGKVWILQAKRVQGSVGRPVVQQLYGAMIHEGACGAIVVTTGNVSGEAREWAKGKPFQFVEIEEVIKLVEFAIDSLLENGPMPMHEPGVPPKNTRPKRKKRSR